jgi:hypothetical protein
MKKILLCIVTALTCAWFSACTNETTPIGLDLIDNQVGTYFMDTITLEAYSMLEDTINTTQSSADILGHLSDPVFGNSSAGIYAQLSLSGSTVNFGTNPIIDSVVLTLQISGYYGDTNSYVGIRVHKLTSDLSTTDQYYQTSTVDYDPNILNYSLTGYNLRPKTPIVVDTALINAHLRIRLSQDFGQDLLNRQDEINNDFSSFLKGLYIEATSHTGNCGYMLITNMNSALTGLTVYYHNDSDNNKRYTFPCSEKCARFTHLDHNYSASTSDLFVREVLQNHKDLGEEILYVQGGGGVKTRITFPYLEKTFAEDNERVIIHRAELVITNVDPSEVYLIQPNLLTLQGIRKSDGAVRFLPDDDYYTNSAYFGGTYDSKKHEYRFRITNYVQDLILGQEDWCNYINLVVRGSAVRPHRLIFDGTDPESPTRLRLEIGYSIY